MICVVSDNCLFNVFLLTLYDLWFMVYKMNLNTIYTINKSSLKNKTIASSEKNIMYTPMRYPNRVCS